MPEGDYVLVNCVNCHGYLLWLFYNVVQDVFVMIFSIVRDACYADCLRA